MSTPDWGFGFAELDGYRLYECPECRALVRGDNRVDHDAWHAARHGFAGRMVGPDRDKDHDAFPVVSYCRCGLGFFGYGAADADRRFHEHIVPPAERGAGWGVDIPRDA